MWNDLPYTVFNIWTLDGFQGSVNRLLLPCSVFYSVFCGTVASGERNLWTIVFFLLDLCCCSAGLIIIIIVTRCINNNNDCPVILQGFIIFSNCKFFRGIQLYVLNILYNSPQGTCQNFSIPHSNLSIHSPELTT